MIPRKDRQILGMSEKVTIIGKKKKRMALARIDTGAKTSSIAARLAAELELGPITNTRQVKSASGTSTRPIIMVKIKMKNKIYEEEFTVADRAHMKYNVLIGRNILKHGFLIDPMKS